MDENIAEALTRTRARIMLTVLKTCCVGVSSIAFLFRVSILSLRSDTLTLRVRGAILVGVA